MSLRTSQVFCRTSQLKSRKTLRRNCLLGAGSLTNLPWFQGALPDHVRVCSNPRYVTRSPPIGKRIELGGVTIHVVRLLGSLSNHDGNNNDNVAKGSGKRRHIVADTL